MLSLLTESSIEALQDIDCLYVGKHAEDMAAAVRSGAVLLGIAKRDNDDDGEGFRFLIGLRRGTKITPYLQHYFMR